MDRKAVYKPYAQAIPGAFAIEKIDTAPCRVACPANLNVQGYVAMVKMGKYREAVEIIMENGRTVRVWSGFGESTLRRVMGIVGGAGAC